MNKDTVDRLMSARGAHVALAVIIGVAVIGYFAGVGAAPEAPAPPSDDLTPAASADAPTAASYGAMRERDLGPNAHFEPHFERLHDPPEGQPIAPGPERERALTEALEGRAEHRAYDGAPPTIPHAVGQNQAAECLTCHRDGAVVEDRVASPISHPPYTNCTQCHVTERSPVPLPPSATPGPIAAGSSFVGLAPERHGARAYAGAPPQIPHPTTMRGECGSCHGPFAPLGMQTTHPERESCTQCHAPSARFNQLPTARP